MAVGGESWRPMTIDNDQLTGGLQGGVHKWMKCKASETENRSQRSNSPFRGTSPAGREGIDGGAPG